MMFYFVESFEGVILREGFKQFASTKVWTQFKKGRSSEFSEIVSQMKTYLAKCLMMFDGLPGRGMVSDHGLGLFGVVAGVHGPVVGELRRVCGPPPGNPRALQWPRRAVGGSEEVCRAPGLLRHGRGHPCHGGGTATGEELHQVGAAELRIEGGALEAGGGHRGYWAHRGLLGWKINIVFITNMEK